MNALQASVFKRAFNHDGSRKSGSSDTRKGFIETTLWDAQTLAGYTVSPKEAHTIGAGNFYMGPDYASQRQRQRIKDKLSRNPDCKILKLITKQDNFGRATVFKIGGNGYITICCKDPKGYCNKKGQGKGVGGYAWTYRGWFWQDYHYINVCPVFSTYSSLNQKMDEIQKDLSRGNVVKLTDATHFATDMLLHEMMHIKITGIPKSK